MLDVGLTVRARSRQVGGISLAYESDGVRGELFCKTSCRGAAGIGLPGAAARLLGPDGRGEHDFIGFHNWAWAWMSPALSAQAASGSAVAAGFYYFFAGSSPGLM